MHDSDTVSVDFVYKYTCNIYVCMTRHHDFELGHLHISPSPVPCSNCSTKFERRLHNFYIFWLTSALLNILVVWSHIAKIFVNWTMNEMMIQKHNLSIVNSYLCLLLFRINLVPNLYKTCIIAQVICYTILFEYAIF